MATRLGVDVGGTFTDLVFYDDVSGEVTVAKGSTTPTAPDEGVDAVVRSTVATADLRSAEFFLHGTTVGINALLERAGAVVGLLITRGFRDVLETRRGDRDAMYDMLWKPPPPCPVALEATRPGGSTTLSRRAEMFLTANFTRSWRWPRTTTSCAASLRRPWPLPPTPVVR